MAQIVIRTTSGDLLKYDTIASGVGPIRTELETSISFLCTDLHDRYTVLVLREGVAAFIQRTGDQYLADVQ